VLQQEFARPLLLNVNFPPEKAKGVRLTRLGTRHYEDTIREDIDDKGNPFIVIAGTAIHREQDKDTDCQVIEEGCISVTPLKLDLSDFEAVVRMSSWKFFSDKR
jgi:5'-nucleotidase